MVSKIVSDFSSAFQEAGGVSVLSYSNLVRFIAVMALIIAILWSMVHFMGADAKESDSFLVEMGTRIVRLMIGLTLFILFLTT